MKTDNKNKKLITHDGSFHADDIFAAATLSFLLEENNEVFEIIRTRDEKIIKTGDYVFDVGGIYNEENNRFDHHQIGGAGKRENGIEYSSFGLVWKKFGEKLTKGKREMQIIDEKLVVAIDAHDNGFSLTEKKYENSPYLIQDFFYSMRPTWREDNLTDDGMFLKCVEIAKIVLSREIVQARDKVLAEEIITSVYKNTPDKRIIVLDKYYPYENILGNFPEPLFVVSPSRTIKDKWSVKAIRKDQGTFINKKNFPKLWAGLRDEELQNVSGVSNAVFCHRALFLVVAKSKEGAIKLAQIAVES